MRHDRIRWEQRYLERGRHSLDPPSTFLQRHRALIPPGPILDVAAGDGRNAIYLGRHGHSVDAIDIAFSGLRRIAAVARDENLAVRVVQADLDDLPLPHRRYAAVVNIRYLQRARFDDLKEAVRPGGIIITETFLVDQQQIGRPANPDHLLQHGELVDRLRGFDIIAAEEGRFDSEGGAAFLARAVARRPAGTS